MCRGERGGVGRVRVWGGGEGVDKYKKQYFLRNQAFSI